MLCFEQMEELLTVIDKVSDTDLSTSNAVVEGHPLTSNGGNGLSRACSAVGDGKDFVDTKGKPDAVVPEQQLLVVPETRPKSRHSSGERKSRHWSGDRRSRHPSKEKDPPLSKSERLYKELMEAVASDNAPRTRSVIKHSQLAAEGRLRGLHAAVQRGCVKAAKAILEMEPTLVHRPDPDSGNTALLVAIEASTVSTMSLLVDRGARLDTKNCSGETAWDVARRFPHDNKGLVPTLVGLYKQHSKHYRTTPIHEAAAVGDVDKIQFLVNAGLDLWDTDSSGYNFIHLAAFNNQTDVILRYLQHCAQPAEITPAEPDVDRRCRTNRKTALHVAANRGHLESTMALLRCGANINALDNGRWTPLHDAVVCRNEASAATVIPALYENALSLILALTTDKETPLHVAARHGRLGAVQVLLKLLADRCGEALSMQDVDGWTPLHSAVDSRCPEVVQIIIDALNTTCDAHSLYDLPDKFDRSPLQLAQSLPDCEEVARLLLSFRPAVSPLGITWNI